MVRFDICALSYYAFMHCAKILCTCIYVCVCVYVVYACMHVCVHMYVHVIRILLHVLTSNAEVKHASLVIAPHSLPFNMLLFHPI